jgi:hypothetical protein
MGLLHLVPSSLRVLSVAHRGSRIKAEVKKIPIDHSLSPFGGSPAPTRPTNDVTAWLGLS